MNMHVPLQEHLMGSRAAMVRLGVLYAVQTHAACCPAHPRCCQVCLANTAC